MCGIGKLEVALPLVKFRGVDEGVLEKKIFHLACEEGNLHFVKQSNGGRSVDEVGQGVATASRKGYSNVLLVDERLDAKAHLQKA